jgi:hypothetical protein
LEALLRELARDLLIGKLVRLPGMGFPSLTIWMPQVTLFAVANCNALGRARWEGAILLLNHNRATS